METNENYQIGLLYLAYLLICAEKLAAFVHLCKLSESDGRVHAKEVRLLLYSIRQAGIEFDDVVHQAKQQGSKNG